MKIIIPGKPIAKKRPRFARHGKFVKVYSDQETEESRFLWEAKTVWDREPLKGAVSIWLEFYFERPKSHFGTGRNTGILKRSAPEYHIQKPDLDNLKKFVFDALNGLCWHDDKQIVYAEGFKDWGKVSRTVVTVKPGCLIRAAAHFF